MDVLCWHHINCVDMPNSVYNYFGKKGDEAAWLCKECSLDFSKSKEAKTPKLSAVIEKPSAAAAIQSDQRKMSSKNIDEVAEKPKPFCPFFKKGKCWHGKSGKKLINGRECQFQHPPKCIKYCRFGWDKTQGCDGSCGLLHPTLCKNSLRYRECFDPDCTLAHLSGTERFDRKPVEQRVSHQQDNGFSTPLAMGNYHRRPNQNTGPHRFNQGQFRSFGKERFQRNLPSRLGFREHGHGVTYQPVHNKIHASGGLLPTPHSQGRNDGFAYKQGEFPPLPTAEGNKISELSSAVQKMQSCLEYLMSQAKLNISQQSAAGNQHLPLNTHQKLSSSSQPTFVQQLPCNVAKN